MKKIIYLVISVVIALLVVVNSNNVVSAKSVSKTGEYSGGNAKDYSEHFGNRITKVKYKGSKVTITGGLYFVFTDKYGNRIDPRTIKGKMTFNISKKCKYYKNYKKISKKTFKKNSSPLKNNWCLSFKVKKKKIVRMDVYSYPMY